MVIMLHTSDAPPPPLSCHALRTNSDASLGISWTAAAYPPPDVPASTIGPDTICAVVSVPCTPAAAALNSYLAISGNISHR